MSKKYIDGIYNYCDAWCERCPFTARCRNFQMRRAMERRMERRDRENAAFWEAMDKACGEEMAELSKQSDALEAEQELSAQERLEREDFGRELDKQDRAVRAHRIVQLAHEYLAISHRWLERRRDRVPGEIADAFEIIAWYHMFIEVKLARGLHGRMHEQEMGELSDVNGLPYPKDSDGSAKVAVIAIERSFAAWSIVRDRVEREAKAARKMMGMLLRLRAMVERTFPEARKFKRPGFDAVGTRD